MSRLDHEERELLEAFEAGKLKRVSNAADTQKRHQEYVEAMFKVEGRLHEELQASRQRRLG